MNISVGSTRYFEKFSGNPPHNLPLTPIEYGDRLYSKFFHGLTDDLKCNRELVSVYHHTDVRSNLFVAASAVLILRKLDATSGSKMVNDEIPDNNDEMSINLPSRLGQAFIAEVPAMEPYPDAVPNNLSEIRLQVWRYINGVPLLYSEEATSCCLLTAVKSFNWLAYGHNIKYTDMEMDRTHKLLACQPSLMLIGVRNSRKTQVCKLLSSVGIISKLVDEFPSCAIPPREMGATLFESISGRSDGVCTSNDSSDHQTRSGNDWMSKKQKNDHVVDDRANNEPGNVDQEMAVDEVVQENSSQLSTTATLRHSFEARDLIVILDVNTPDGKKIIKNYDDNCQAKLDNIDSVVSYVSVAKTGISGNSKAFQNAVNKGLLRRIM